MRRALIGGPAAIVSQLQANGGYSDVFLWDQLADYGRRRFDEIVMLSVGLHRFQSSIGLGPIAKNIVRFSDGDTSSYVARCESPILTVPIKSDSSLTRHESDHPSNLLHILQLFQAKRVTLVSTLDVYPNPSLPLDEDISIDEWPNSTSGRRQLALERWVLRHFASAFIVRIPMLYGPGVENSVLNALIHPQHAAHVNPAAIYQWYPLLRLQRDLAIARHRRLPIVNLATEPLSISRIISRLFPRAVVAAPSTPAPYSRLATKHAQYFGGLGDYIMRAEDVLHDMDVFLKTSAICKRRVQIAS